MPVGPIPLEALSQFFTKGIQSAREAPRGESVAWNLALGALSSLPINASELLSMASPFHTAGSAEALGYAVGDAVAKNKALEMAKKYPFELAMVLPGPRKLMGRKLPPELRFYAEKAGEFPSISAFYRFMDEPSTKVHKSLAMEVVRDNELAHLMRQMEAGQMGKKTIEGVPEFKAVSVPIGKAKDFVRHPYTRQFLSSRTLEMPVYVFGTDAPVIRDKAGAFYDNIGLKDRGKAIYLSMVLGDPEVINHPSLGKGDAHFPYSVLLEEVFHAERDTKGRGFKYFDDSGFEIPYSQRLHEITAKKAVEKFMPFELPGRSMLEKNFPPIDFYMAAKQRYPGGLGHRGRTPPNR